MMKSLRINDMGKHVFKIDEKSVYLLQCSNHSFLWFFFVESLQPVLILFYRILGSRKCTCFLIDQLNWLIIRFCNVRTVIALTYVMWNILTMRTHMFPVFLMLNWIWEHGNIYYFFYYTIVQGSLLQKQTYI